VEFPPAVTMPGENSNCCPVLRPTKAQFSRPFESFVSEYFRKNPEVPMVKVIPPKGYTPRKAEYPTDLKIDTPIEQRVRNAAAVSKQWARASEDTLSCRRCRC